jgi:hypothetical protein
MGSYAATLPRNFAPTPLPVAQPVSFGRSLSVAPTSPAHMNGATGAPANSPGPGGVPSGTGDREW